MESNGWLEYFLGPLENLPKEILKNKGYSSVPDGLEFLSKAWIKTFNKAGNEYYKRMNAKEQLKEIDHFRSLVLENRIPRDVIYSLTWILGRAYDMGWPKPYYRISGSSKGGKASKKQPWIFSLIREIQKVLTDKRFPKFRTHLIAKYTGKDNGLKLGRGVAYFRVTKGGEERVFYKVKGERLRDILLESIRQGYFPRKKMSSK